MQTARKPNSVLDDHSSRRRITAPLQQPTRKFRLPTVERQPNLSAWAHRADTLLPPEEERRDPCLFGLAPCGVYHAAVITARAVRSYRTFSPLPQAECGFTEVDHRLGAVCSLLHWPSSCLEASVPDVIRHTALRSSDFPPPPNALRRRAAAIIRPPAVPSVSHRLFGWSVSLASEIGEAAESSVFKESGYYFS